MSSDQCTAPLTLQVNSSINRSSNSTTLVLTSISPAAAEQQPSTNGPSANQLSPTDKDVHQLNVPVSSRGISPHEREPIPLAEENDQSIVPSVWQEHIAALGRKCNCPYNKCNCEEKEITEKRAAAKLLLQEMRDKYVAEHLARDREDEEAGIVKRPHNPMLKCIRCQNHGLLIAYRGHKRHCPFQTCRCEECELTRTRQLIMARNVAGKNANQ